jgi:hypothetical protein
VQAASKCVNWREPIDAVPPCTSQYQAGNFVPRIYQVWPVTFRCLHLLSNSRPTKATARCATFYLLPLPSLSFEIDFQSIYIPRRFRLHTYNHRAIGSELNQYSESAVTTWTLSTMRLSAIQVALVIVAVRVIPWQYGGPSKVSPKYFMLLWVSEVLFMSALNHKTLKWLRNF